MDRARVIPVLSAWAVAAAGVCACVAGAYALGVRASAQDLAPSTAASPAAAGPNAAATRSRHTSVGASPGQCRTQCAATRYACLAADTNADGGDCTTSWSQCVVGCGGSTYGFSSTAPQSFVPGLAPQSR